MVIWVKEENLRQFLPLIPEEFQDEVISGELLCLGALAEDKTDERTAAGVLLFSVEDGLIYEEEQSVMIVVHWIYVAEAERQKGLANELVDALSDVLDDSPAEGVICDIPMDSEYDLAEAFFTSWGFEFRVIDSCEMIISKEDFRKKMKTMESEDIKKAAKTFDKPEGLTAIPDIDEEAFKKALQAMKEAEKTGYYDGVSENMDDYAGDMSYAIMHKGEISSMILFSRDYRDDLVMVLLSSLSTKGAKELLDLLYYSSGYYYMNYPEDVQIHLFVGIEKSRNLATHIFPGKDPVMVRRGYFS